MNLTILRGGLRRCPAFIGCYSEDLGTVCYANAGHTPGLLRDQTGITLLEATGLPLGLFSHTTQSAATCHLLPGAALVAVSRGIIEADMIEADNQIAEFGLDGVKLSFQGAAPLGARAMPDRATGGPGVHFGGSHPQRSDDGGAGAAIRLMMRAETAHLIQGASCDCDVPGFHQKLLDGEFLNTFLHRTSSFKKW
jgi:Stage II sporulation protein E (SpoIIE)